MAETLKISISGQGQPLVLIHGWGLNSGIWQPTVTALSEQFQVITVDLPGFGINHQITPESYTIENLASMVEQAVSVAVDAKPVYIGWSLGGLVATQIALQSPEKVAKLVNVCSSPFFVEQSLPSELWPGIKPDVLSAFHQQLATDSHKTINSFLKIQAMGSPHIRQDVKEIKQLVMDYPFPETDTLDKALNLLETVDLRQQLTKLALPCLRLYGRLDSLVPYKVIDKIAQLETVSHFVERYTFKSSSHAPFISEPELFIEVLANWLNGKQIAES